MNDKTDELLSELDNMRGNTPPSQADHLLQALKNSNVSTANQISESNSSTPTSSIDDVDDLLELMNDDIDSEKTSTPETTMHTTTNTTKKPVKDSSHSTNNATPTSEVEAVALALEAAKAAQVAAENSQKSSELAIKNAHELKAELVELSDSNYAWRQAVKSASKELKTTKNTVSLLATISIIFSIAAAGIMGYYLYSLNKKYEQLKGEVLDIIQTENTLFQKKFSTKVDELSSLIEFLTSKIEKISPSSGAQPHITPVNTYKDTNKIAENNLHGNQDHNETPSTQTHTPSLPHHNNNDHQNHMPHSEPHGVTPSTVDYSADLNDIKQVIQNILHKQQSLESLLYQAIRENKDSHPPSHPAPTLQHSNRPIIAKLSSEDEKKLAAIRWLIKQQGKQIKQIQAAIKQNKHNTRPQNSGLNAVQSTLKAIQQQVRALQKQQDELRKEVQSLKQETLKLSTNRPYFYRAPGTEP